MNIGFLGTGYVGLVSGICLAQTGHFVSFFDIYPTRINQLNAGQIPIYEFGLDKIIEEVKGRNRILFTHDYPSLIQHNDILFITVGTPCNEDEDLNIQFVYDAAEKIGQHIQKEKLIVIKSTVPMGTSEKVFKIISKHIKQRQLEIDFDVCFNPEFLREGTAIHDFIHPDRIIIGSLSLKTRQIMIECYSAFLKSAEIMFMSPKAAELSKYAANAMLAMKISFINEIANIADRYDIDILDVKKGITSDTRIGKHFLNAGCGYGGSCFSKDINALISIANELGVDTHLLKAVNDANKMQKKVLVEKIKVHFNNKLENHVFALWGLAFKPGTDDIREAPSVVIIEELLKCGAKIQAFDPAANAHVRRKYTQENNIKIVNSIEETLPNISAIIICTEWEIFKLFDLDKVTKAMLNPVIFDGRNIFDPHLLEKKNIQYYGVGRHNAMLCSKK